MGFKEPEANVFLSSPITAKILEVERFTSAQDRFYITTQRSINKVRDQPVTGAVLVLSASTVELFLSPVDSGPVGSQKNH